MRSYFQWLNDKYRFVYCKTPPRKWINTNTLVTSNIQDNPDGRYTTVGIYYIVEQSNVHLHYALSIRYTEDPVPFEHIYRWISEHAFDIAVEHAPLSAFVIEVTALTFERTEPKPDHIRYH